MEGKGRGRLLLGYLSAEAERGGGGCYYLSLLRSSRDLPLGLQLGTRVGGRGRRDGDDGVGWGKARR